MVLGCIVFVCCFDAFLCWGGVVAWLAFRDLGLFFVLGFWVFLGFVVCELNSVSFIFVMPFIYFFGAGCHLFWCLVFFVFCLNFELFCSISGKMFFVFLVFVRRV